MYMCVQEFISVSDYFFIHYIFLLVGTVHTCTVYVLSSSFLNYGRFFIGEAHFNAYQKPLLYFQVLFLTGQFEAVRLISNLLCKISFIVNCKLLV